METPEVTRPWRAGSGDNQGSLKTGLRAGDGAEEVGTPGHERLVQALNSEGNGKS